LPLPAGKTVCEPVGLALLLHPDSSEVKQLWDGMWQLQADLQPMGHNLKRQLRT